MVTFSRICGGCGTEFLTVYTPPVQSACTHLSQQVSKASTRSDYKWVSWSRAYCSWPGYHSELFHDAMQWHQYWENHSLVSVHSMYSAMLILKLLLELLIETEHKCRELYIAPETIPTPKIKKTMYGSFPVKTWHLYYAFCLYFPFLHIFYNFAFNFHFIFPFPSFYRVFFLFFVALLIFPSKTLLAESFPSPAIGAYFPYNHSCIIVYRMYPMTLRRSEEGSSSYPRTEEERETWLQKQQRKLQADTDRLVTSYHMESIPRRRS